ncbi:MAG TPA: alpha/beta fold hydrolase [Polyangia bacterium]|nr:alpha/beta fold hydrolase [Polyangia bacterium]
METIAINGIDLAYELRGDGPPLLMLHGFFGSSGDWVHLFDVEALARRFRLILPDARGHGRSTNPTGELTHRRAADDIRGLLDHLRLDRVRAVGLSFGGNILLHLATAAATRDRLQAMVTIGSPSHFPAPARAIMASVTVESRTDDDWREMRARHVHGDEQIRALWRTARGFSTDTEDLAFTPAQLGSIRARTLIVTGDRDPLYPLEIFVDQYRAIPGAALYVIPEGGHDAVFRAARPDFVRTALAFLEP